jgi:hypothetical protein
VTQLLPSISELIESAPTFQNVRSFGTDLEELLLNQRAAMETNYGRKLIPYAQQPTVDLNRGKNVFETTESHSFAEKLFNSLVELKVGVAEYAMHLTPDVRAKIFKDLDDLLNVDDWHEDDLLPRLLSFRDFLKWTIYSKRFNWLSLGFSDEGNVLVAWKSGKGMLTASYDGAGRVWWTAAITLDGELNHVAGDSTLEYFETEARRLD